ncbi:MAG: 30S ribosomal protein S20 [bacterium]|nr:30S ribosomal protein S20 [bacterium]
MPIIRAAKKSLRQAKKHRQENLKKREAFKSAIKKLKKLALTKEIGEATKLLSQSYKALDKAVKGNVIKKNTASRSKSRLAKFLNKASKQVAPTSK